MFVLPISYLFWWKKRWRLILGIAIVIILVVGYVSPGEIAYSILSREIAKDKKNLTEKIERIEKKLTESLKKTNSEDQEKYKLEKDIKELEKKVKESRGPDPMSGLIKWALKEKKREWSRKYGEESFSKPFLFCGEEFNHKLTKEYEIDNKKYKLTENVIDFNDYGKSSSEKVKEKILEIIKKEEEYKPLYERYSVILFKNVDKITNQELEKLLLSFFNPQSDASLWKYEREERDGRKNMIIPVLSEFTFITTTSTANPKLSKELRTKLKHIEPILDKYFWIIFFVSSGMETVVILLLIRNRKKSKGKLLKRFNY